MSIMNTLFLLIAKWAYIHSFLPTSGKFYISRYSDSTCTIATSVKQVNPTGACWSIDYDNGIKPTAYDEEKLVLSMQLFDTSSCYGTEFAKANIKCDDTECIPNPKNTGQYLKCTYLSYPAKANFTLTKYSDNECQYQSGVIVLKGDSNCWTLSNEESISPIHFIDIRELSYYAYRRGDCTGAITKPSTIICNNSCFASPLQLPSEYFRCNYLLSHQLEISYISSIVLILLLLL